METLSVTFVGDPQTYHVITDCNESDTCPGCGAGYKAGFIECEYCRRPVGIASHVTIQEDAKVSVQSGDCWQVISGPDVGKLVPMTEEEKALKPAWK